MRKYLEVPVYRGSQLIDRVRVGHVEGVTYVLEQIFVGDLFGGFRP